jgi:hypothetical protein
MGWRVVWLLLLSIYPTSRAWAQAGTAQDWFHRGVALSRTAQWPEARAAYLRSLELAPRVSTYFNLATATLKLKLGRETLLALEDFTRLADPRVHTEFLAEAARMRAEALQLTGTVMLTAAPDDTTVEIDQEARRWPVGSDYQVSLDPGQHVLVLRAPSYIARSLQVDVTRGSTTRLTPALSRVPVPAPPLVKADKGAYVWGGVAAVGLGVLATVLVLTLRSDSQDTPRGAGGSLNMVFD